jgi:hypothetical protein
MLLDVKKLFLSVDASGSLQGRPAAADISLAAVIVSTRVTYRF